VGFEYGAYFSGAYFSGDNRVERDPSGVEREVFLIQFFLPSLKHKCPTNELDTTLIRWYRLTHVVCLVRLAVLAMHVPPEPAELPQRLSVALARHQDLPTLEDRLSHHVLICQCNQSPPWLSVPPSSNAVALSGEQQGS
jgi:hypothetical protein